MLDAYRTTASVMDRIAAAFTCNEPVLRLHLLGLRLELQSRAT